MAPARTVSSPARKVAGSRQSGPAPNRQRSNVSAVFLLCLAACGFAGAGSAAGLMYSFSKLPDVSTLQTYVPFETTMIFDGKNRLIAQIHGEENRVVVPLGEIPRHVRNAVIAAEDVRFYFHRGVDPRGIARALLKDVAGGRAEEGASTLTQQLAKNLFLSPSKTVSRKLADAWLALAIERRYSKDQILELYLNQVYWGHNSYGIQAASQTYFGKNVKQLDLAEGALIAGLLGGPERFSPYRDVRLARMHQRHVLSKMVEAGFITAGQAKAAAAVPLVFPKEPPRQREVYRAPYFTNYLLEQLVDRYGSDMVYKGGLRVHATLDLAMQAEGERLLSESIAKYGKVHHFSQGALVCIDPTNGAIRALVGGKNWQISKFNRVVQAQRQPGSSFKPFVYLTAFAQSISPGLVMNDSAQSYLAGNGKWWAPQNYGNEHYGDISLRKALEVSNNVIAVKLINRVGVENVVETAHRIGISSNLEPNLSLALGTSEVTPLELCAAYAVFANDGKRCEPICYNRVDDRAGTVLEERHPQARQVFPSEPIRVLTDVLSGVIARGTGYEARVIARPAAGKTGTTSDHRDAWFVGYTPNLVAAVWLGNDDNSPMTGGTTGGDVCAPLWARFMKTALQGVPPTPFAKPLHPEVLQPRKPRLQPATTSVSTGLVRRAGQSPNVAGGSRPLPLSSASTPKPDSAGDAVPKNPEPEQEPAQSTDESP